MLRIKTTVGTRRTNDRNIASHFALVAQVTGDWGPFSPELAVGLERRAFKGCLVGILIGILTKQVQRGKVHDADETFPLYQVGRAGEIAMGNSVGFIFSAFFPRANARDRRMGRGTASQAAQGRWRFLGTVPEKAPVVVLYAVLLE